MHLRPLAVAAVLLILAAVAWRATIPIAETPQSLPSIIGGLTPVDAPLDTKTGYVLAIQLTVSGCNDKVQGTAYLRFPREFVAAGESEAFDDFTPPDRVLAGLAFSDSTVRIKSIEPSSLSHPRSKPPFEHGWTEPLPSKRSSYFAGHPSGRVVVMPLDGWQEEKAGIAVDFEANWLRPRSHTSCWLGIPDISGPRALQFAHHAANTVEYDLGRGAKTEDLSTMRSKVGPGWFTMTANDGTVTTRRYPQIDLGRPQISGDGIAALGITRLKTPLNVLSDASTIAPSRPGAPQWTCSTTATAMDALTGGGFTEKDAFVTFASEGTRSFKARADEAGCGGWVAIAEPGAASARDLWLLIVGALLSLSAAIVVDTILRRPGDAATA